MLNLTDKLSVVTGSTSGIGKATAENLAKSGSNIVINGFGDKKEIEQTVEQIRTKYNVDVIYSDADLTDEKQISNLFEVIDNKFGRVDILVNNAGMQYVSPIDEFPVEKWNQIIALNLTASFHTTRLAIPLMKKNSWGRIINIASAHALVASPYKSAYVAAKHGLAGLTKVTSLEYAQDNITCNAICPGYVWTPLVENQVADTAKLRGITEEEVKNNVLLAAQPTKKFSTVEQVAEFALMLCSETMSNTTGAIIPIDGGWTAQ